MKVQDSGDFYWEQHAYLEESAHLQLILPRNEAPKRSDQFRQALVLSKLLVGVRSVQLVFWAASSSELESASVPQDSLLPSLH